MLDRLAFWRRLDPRLLADLHTQRRPIRTGLTCTAIAALLSVSVAKLLQFATQAIESLADIHKKGLTGAVAESTRARGMEQILLACLMIFVIYGCRYWFVRGQTYYLSEAANRLAMNLRVRMMAKLMQLPISYFNDRRAGAIQSVMTNDVNVYQNAVSLIRDAVGGPILAVGSFAYILVLQWQLSLITVALVPLIAVVIQRNAKRMRVVQTGVQEDLASVTGTSVELLQGMRVIKAFGAEKTIQAEYEHLVDRSFRSQMKAVALTAALGPLVELIGACGIAFLVYICGILATSGSLTFDKVVAIVFAADRINLGFRSLGSISNTLAMVQAASARINEQILDVPEGHEAGGDKVLVSPAGRVEFENVSFQYPDGTKALCDVSFTIEPGSSLALVGPSGAGKTTIADLLLRFYEPTAGRILFDGTDIRSLDVGWLRSHIGVVPQHTFLFAGSIEENVMLGAQGASEDDLRLALRQASAEEFTAEMSSRSTAELGERGVKLSGGQMQRIAIARALIRKPTVLLLDEATSALDATSEKSVTGALSEVMRTRTTLFIAHRLTTAARADKILVLSHGRAVEYGSHAELIDANGAYAGLFRAFSGGVLD